MTEIIVYTARKIRTMNPSMPEATAVAVRDGMIVEIGTVETMQPWLEAHPHRIDDRFSDHVIMPGFIDPHLHPSLAAVLLPCHFITALEWKPPDRVSPPVQGHNAYLDRLTEIEQSLDDPGEPLVTWGFHKIWHGDVNRQTLNGFSATRVIARDPPAHNTPLRKAGPPACSWKAQVQVGTLSLIVKSQTVMWP